MTHYRAARSLHHPTRPSSALLRGGIGAASVAAATVLTAMSAQVSVTLPGSPIPFTLQPVAVLLAGAVLGARLGALSQALYLVLGIAGASTFAWSPVLLPGAARLLGPTGGFLIAFPLAAAATGWLADRGWTSRAATACAAFIVGLAVLYTGGVAWLALTTPAGARLAMTGALGPYVAADLVKVGLASAAWSVAQRAFAR